jgi:hypothetical protein
MWTWLKSHWKMLNLGVSTLGVIASTFIAYFAYQIDQMMQYQIDQMMQESAAKEARISRSVALTQIIFSDRAIMRLLPVAQEIEINTERAFNRNLSELSAEKKADATKLYKAAHIQSVVEMQKKQR